MNARRVRVGELAEQVRGVSYAKHEASSEPEPGHVPVLRAGNITDAGLLFDDLVFVPRARVAEKQKIRCGDVVIAASSGSLDVVGKAAAATADFDGGFGAFCKVLRPNGRVHPGYFAHFFKTKSYRQRVSALAAGANINNLRNEHLDELEVRLPTIDEQRRIAEVLDRAEALRAKRRATIKQLDTFVECVFLDLFGDPARNTKGLPTVTLGELGDWQSGGTPPRDRASYFRGSIPWFSSGELDRMYLTQSREYISDVAVRETSAKLVRRGALMLGMYDTAALKAAIADVDCSCNQAVAFATIHPRLADVTYVYYAIVIGREYFRRLQRGVRQKNLNLSMIREIRIPLPPHKLEQEFLRRIAAVNDLRLAQDASALRMELLVAGLQHRAFRGEL